MMRATASFALLALLLVAFIANPTSSTESQCQKDCEAPPTLRILGPTRPSDEDDGIGNDLRLTRPHPFSQAPMEAAVVRFNSTVRLSMPNFDSAKHSVTSFHKNYVLRCLKKIAVKFVSNDLKVIEAGPLTASGGGGGGYFTDLSYQSEYVVDFTGSFNYSTTDEFLDLVWTTFEAAAGAATPPSVNNLTSTLALQTARSKSSAVKESLANATITLPSGYARPSVGANTLVEFMRLQTPNPNPNSMFCKAGCTFFFSVEVSVAKSAKLSTCTDRCDTAFRSKEHISVGYSDLADVARLECRDGCSIALMRCQPGYKCTLAKPYKDDSGATKHTDGEMAICPPGTYRDVSYDQVEECIDCPPGRYREDNKGRYMESCSKCPIGKYVNATGSNSILQCLRCPAGRFGNQPGKALCECINDQACLHPQKYASPADAEKRATFPFEGRW